MCERRRGDEKGEGEVRRGDRGADGQPVSRSVLHDSYHGVQRSLGRTWLCTMILYGQIPDTSSSFPREVHAAYVHDRGVKTGPGQVQERSGANRRGQCGRQERMGEVWGEWEDKGGG